MAFWSFLTFPSSSSLTTSFLSVSFNFRQSLHIISNLAPTVTPNRHQQKPKKTNTWRMKKQKYSERAQHSNPFEALSEELVFTILDFLQPDSQAIKSFSQSCKWFYSLESRHRRVLRPLRADHLPAMAARYPSVAELDLSRCPRVGDGSLTLVAAAYQETLRRVDLSRSRFFTGNGVLSLAVSCRNLVELDLSNATELGDAAAAAVARAGNLRKLWLSRCKLITDMGIGCIAVWCRKLRLICLKWCVGVGDLGVGLLAIKCKELRTLDLSYLPVSFLLLLLVEFWILFIY